MATKHQPATKTTIRLRPADSKRVQKIIDAGWATSANGAIRYALTLASKNGS